MANKRGFLGTTEVDTEDYWTNGKGGQQLKLNETNLYAEIDLCQEILVNCENALEEQEQYRRQDVLWLCLKAVEYAGADDNLLRKGGRIIGNMATAGMCSRLYTTMDGENAMLEVLCKQLKERMQNDAESISNPSFNDWFEEVVVECNYYQNLDGSKTKDKPRLFGLGATETKDTYSKQLKEYATTLLYSIQDSEDLYSDCTDESEMRQKLMGQSETVQWFANSGTNMTTRSVKLNIQSGCSSKLGGKTPKEALAKYKNECAKAYTETEPNGLGCFVVSSIIAAIITLVILLAKMIISIVQQKREAKLAESVALAASTPTQEELEMNMPTAGDYDNSALEIEMQKAQDALAESNENLNKIVAESQTTETPEEEDNTMLYVGLGVGGVVLVGSVAFVAVRASKKKKSQGKDKKEQSDKKE
jgi:hypothetical protein